MTTESIRTEDSRQPEKKKSYFSYLGPLLVLILLVLIVSLHLASPTHPVTRIVFEPPLLLPTLNTIFVFLAGCTVSYLAMRSYLSWGSSTILFFGCGMLSLGSGAFVAGWLIGPWGPNVNTTIFTLSAFLSSIFHTAGMIMNVMERPPEAVPAGRRRKLAAAYLGLLALVALIALAAVAGIIPPFFIRGAGSTTLRQVFVAATLVLFIITSSSSMILFVQKGVRFLYWYSLGLALFALNTFGALLQPALGSPMGWAARCSAFLAGIYFLVAVATALREARTQGIALSEKFAEIFRRSERKISFIFASMTDCYYELDRGWRFTRINDQCLAYFGRSEEEFIGQLFGDVFPEDKSSIFEELYSKAFSEGVSVHFEVQSLVIPDKWAEIHAYPTEEGLSVFIRDITGRKQAEISLRKSEELWATTLSSIGDAVIATDTAGNITFMNAVAEELTGWTLLDAATKPVPEIFNIVNEHTRRQVENPVAKVLREGMVVGLANHTILVRKDGTEAPIDDSGAPIKDSDGRTIGVVLVFRDITERKQAEEHTIHLASFPQINPNPVLEMGLSGKINFYNPAAEMILENLGMDKGDCSAFLPTDMNAILRDWDRKSESTLQREVSIVNRVFGETVHLVPQFNVARIYARDITERKLNEIRISRLTKLYSMLSQVNEAIVRIRGEGLLYEEVCRIIAGEGGFLLAWIGQVKGRQVVPAASYGPAVGYLKEISVEVEGTLGSGPTGTSIRENRPVVNDDFGANVSTAPWREPALRYGFRASAAFPLRVQGMAVGALTLYASEPGAFDAEQVKLLEALSADISYAVYSVQKERLRAEAEEALRKASDELELRVQERTDQLQEAYTKLEIEMVEHKQAEEQLRQAHKMEAIGTLAGGIAHDFNNVLAAIIGFTEMAIDDTTDRPETERNLRRVLKSAMRARDLVKQILTFSRKTSYERTPISLSSLIKETIQLLRASIPTSIDIKLYLNASSDTILAAPVEIQQILMNLATNASLAMQGTGGTLEISLIDIDFTPDSPVSG